MSSSVAANSTDGLGPPFAVDNAAGVYWPYGKVAYGADGVQALVTATNGLPGNLIQIGGEAVPLVNMDYTSVTVQNMMPVALAYRTNSGPAYVATNSGLPVDTSQTVIGIQDGSQNYYLSASATMNQSSGAGLFPAVNVAQFDDVTPTAITEDRFGNLRMSSRRELYVQLRDAAGNERGLNIDANGAISTQARAATVDSIAAKLATDAIMNGTTALTPKFAIIDAATSGDNTLVAAVSGKKIRVLSCVLVAAGAVNARFESGAGGTALSGQMNLTTNSGFTLPFSPVGWFETAAATLLNLELSGAVSVDGCLVYVEV
ncbi:hypothetical protein [Dongia sp.]|uniref:hypothetical protein n=1 Tax=Dongia sp. TaxID=1977262 RepID=UPI0035B4D5C6